MSNSMNEYKILFTGTMGAGKSTAINALSETATVNTDVHNSDTSVDKERTTVGLDFGQFTLDNGDRIRMFGTPGQARFDFLWKILSKGALGLIILADNSRPDPLADICVYLNGFSNELDTLPCTIGVGRLDTHPIPSLDDYADLLAAKNRIVPIIGVDVRRKDDVILLIDVLLSQLESGISGVQA